MSVQTSLEVNTSASLVSRQSSPQDLCSLKAVAVFPNMRYNSYSNRHNADEKVSRTLVRRLFLAPKTLIFGLAFERQNISRNLLDSYLGGIA